MIKERKTKRKKRLKGTKLKLKKKRKNILRETVRVLPKKTKNTAEYGCVL